MVAQTAAIERQTSVMERILALTQANEDRQRQAEAERNKKYKYNNQTYDSAEQAGIAVVNDKKLNIAPALMDPRFADEMGNPDANKVLQEIAKTYCDVVS